MASQRRSIEEILCEAVEIESASERDRYLDQVCGSDAGLRRRVEILVADHFKAGDFLEKPAVEVIPTAEMAPVTEKPGSEIGPYKLREQLGEGGFGVVYVAEQTKPVRRKVALKIIKPGMDTKQVIARFEAERQALALMDHPNIARVLDAGATDSGRPYFAMELVHGVPITEFCDKNKLPTQKRLELFVDICHAVHHAHQKGIIHRDLKPSNIMVTLHDGKPVAKVIDFGVSKALSQQLTEKTIYTSYGQMIGTPVYMSPEQAEMSGLGIDTRSDIYSLGVLLYELLTGKPPLDSRRLLASGYNEMLRIIQEEEPPRPSTKVSSLGDEATVIADHRRTDVKELSRSLRGELDWIVMTALEKDRERRYDTANSFAADIGRFLSDEAVLACPPSTVYMMRKFVSRNRGLVIASSLLLIVLCLGFIGTSIGMAWATHEAHNARSAERIAYEQRDRAQKLAEQNFKLAAAESAARQETQKREETLKEQLRVSAALRLAAQSENLRSELPVRSVLLAIEAVESTRQHHDTITSTAHEALLSATSSLGGKPLVGHEAGIRELAISPNSRWLVTGSSDGTARIWDLEAPGSSPRVLSGHGAAVLSMTMSPDGRWLVTGSQDRTARLWDLCADEPSGSSVVLKGHDGEITSAAIGPNGRWLVTGSQHATSRLWDLTAEDFASRELVGQDIYAVAITPDGRWLVTGNYEGPARLWDLRAEDPTAESIVLSGHKWAVVSLAISSDARWLVTGSWDTTARIWDLKAENPNASPIVLEGQESAIKSVAISPNGRWVATGCEGNMVRLWDRTAEDPSSSSLPLRGHHEGVAAMAISPDSRWLASGSWDGTARLWDLTARHPESSSIVLRGHEASISSVAFSPNRRLLITGSADGTARLWDLSGSSPTYSVLGLGEHNYEVEMSRDGRWLVTTEDKETVRLWDLTVEDPTSTAIRLGEHKEKMSAWSDALAFSPDSRWLVAGIRDNTARLWDLTAEHPESSLRILRGHEGEVWSVTISADGRWLVTGSGDQTARRWDLSRTESAPIELSGHEGAISSVAITPNGRFVITGSWDKSTGLLWDLESAQPVSPAVVLSRHEKPIRLMAISPDGRWLVTAGGHWDSEPTAHIWDLTSATPGTSSLMLDGHEDSIHCIAISADWLVTGSSDSTARLWDLNAQDPTASSLVFQGHRGGVKSVAITPDGRWLLTGGGDATARLWDLTAKDPTSSSIVLRGHEGSIQSVAISPNGRWIATASRDKTARLWDLDVDALIRRMRGVAGRELTPEERKQYLLDGP